MLVNQLVAAGLITNGNGNSLNAKLNAAIGSLEQGQTGAAQGQLNAALNEIDAMIRTGKLSPADAAALRSLVTRVLASIE